MERELLVLRHAKSDWDSDAASDFDRPLANRGRKAAPRIGAWMRERGLQPGLVVASPALRARQTVHRVLSELAEEPPVSWDADLYLASLRVLLGVLASCPPEPARVLLVGHNPGLEELVEHLTGHAEPFPTGGLARVSLPADWTALAPRCGELESFVSPRELED